jgi:hypothetical protein
MATPLEYQLAIKAVLAIVQADIAKEMASMVFKPTIPQDLVTQFATDAAKAAIDAVDAQRAKIEAAKGLA